MRLRRAARIILVGAPRFSAISSGDLLRDNVKNRTPLGIKAESTIKSGSLVPDAMILRLILHELKTRERIAGRWVHAPSGRVYNTTFHAPKVAGLDDITGEKLTKRPDDCEETWKTRLKKFEETSEPLLEHYARKGVLWEVQGNSSDEISPKLYQEFERRFADI
ncbi:hypothetical protein DID88_008734 [Monilinia fructigena]|uniref:Adenylate kinase active site lid domain-containing protein n=1 Tax=Monilinia fructigena TaxID=38457 RepID=A0A395J6D4_9HELO|nr:hypothetical protein DID88_008734 [Monilinia fructigena]